MTGYERDTIIGRNPVLLGYEFLQEDMNLYTVYKNINLFGLLFVHVCSIMSQHVLIYILCQLRSFPLRPRCHEMRSCDGQGCGRFQRTCQLSGLARTTKILLMEEILHHRECINLVNNGDKLPINWCRMETKINSIKFASE